MKQFREMLAEAGFELVYQGSATLLVSPLRLGPGQRLAIRVVQQVTVGAKESKTISFVFKV